VVPQLAVPFKKLPIARTKTRERDLLSISEDELRKIELIGRVILHTNYIKAFIKTFIIIVLPAAGS